MLGDCGIDPFKLSISSSYLNNYMITMITKENCNGSASTYSSKSSAV